LPLPTAAGIEGDVNFFRLLVLCGFIVDLLCMVVHNLFHSLEQSCLAKTQLKWCWTGRSQSINRRRFAVTLQARGFMSGVFPFWLEDHNECSFSCPYILECSLP
jgi:hypothetical protein